MDDYLEIDLRKIIKNIIAKWYWVVLSTVLIGAGIFLYSYLYMADTFRAKATIIITDPRSVTSVLDISNGSVLTMPSASAVQRLALSDDIMLQLLERWDFDEKEGITLSGLREILAIEAYDDAMLYTLSTEFTNAVAAADLANNWANLVVDKVNADYFYYDEAIVEQISTQLATAKSNLDQADAALIDFIENDRRSLLTDRLSSLKSDQSSNFGLQRQLRSVRFDALGILSQLEDQPDATRVDNAFRINFLLLQSRLYSGQSDLTLESPSNSFILSTTDLENQDLDYITVGDFRDTIEIWVDVIDDQLTQLESEEEFYLPTINQIETENRTLEYQLEILTADFNTASQIYAVLLENYEETKISMEIMGEGYVKLASAAAVPDEGLPHNTVRNTLIGLAAGGILGLAGVVIVDWWKSGNSIKESEIETP